MNNAPLFDKIAWRDPISGRPMKPIISARTPAGVPITGALQIEGTSLGYPIVDCVARLTPQLARRYAKWLALLSLDAPSDGGADVEDFQGEETVDSFGWQWTLAGNMRSDADLRMRVAENFRMKPEDFRGNCVLDAGAGAGDQSRFMIEHGAAVVSLDLSDAIEVVAKKLRMEPNWVGVQGDITVLPFPEKLFDIVYCEGVIQHTRDSFRTICELSRVVRSGGILLARHYTMRPPTSRSHAWRRRISKAYYHRLRKWLAGIGNYERLLVTGVLAGLAYVPLIGNILKATGTCMYYDLQPDFKTTWINTYDYYGGHEYQRIIAPETFWGYLHEIGSLEIIFKDDGSVAARKLV